MLVFLLLSYPLLVQGCKCLIVDRTGTLDQALQRRGNQVYSGVVVGATCSCYNGNGTVDCRSYSYFEENDTYIANIVARVRVDVDGWPHFVLRSCTRAENDLAIGTYKVTIIGYNPGILVYLWSSSYWWKSSERSRARNCPQWYQSTCVCLWQLIWSV